MRKSFGFTLIELLIYISIIGFVSGIGLASFLTFNRRQTVRSAVKTMVSDLRLAQNLADSGDKIKNCSGNLLGYRVRYFTNADQTFSYVLEAICSQVVNFKTVDLHPSIRRVSGPSQVTFKSLRQGVIIVPESQKSLVVNFQGGSTTGTVSISEGGEISSD